MDMLQNPTKHESREEIRKKKLAAIGVDVNDIEAQQIEDSALPNKIPPALSKPKPKPKVQDVESTFKEYGFKVSFYFFFGIDVTFIGNGYEFFHNLWTINILY